jgi:hypothetical protein
MSISVTGNVSSVTDMMVLLSSLGFDTGSGDDASEVVIDKFDQWANTAPGAYAASFSCGMQIAA